ncbi:hypothetical protein GCM10011487_44700 [Steroidobacter agaridevorans]|uniref:HTH cro/C1-type domain-containing protein n=1 Tax=Steroidobacter agaridevorans TaxID=2695856 RepID=A0A829YGY3_9GAMM|nr:helix-turn-helix transcriptional regulator [Steroidobacter agaridevorans]GFE82470.1 hypothetical protein GCM10011487_44700 [Steroidobacter agaridevorans]
MNRVQACRSGSIKAESRQYFRKIGARIAQVRKLHGYTQAELARSTGVSQQAVFAYELGDRRVSLLMARKFAKLFRMSMDDLSDHSMPPKVPKGRLSPRAMRHAERIQGLSKTHQRFLIKILDVLEQRPFPAKSKE